MREVGRVDERAADLVGDLLLARDLAFGNFCSISYWTAATELPSFARTSTTFARPSCDESFCSSVTGT